MYEYYAVAYEYLTCSVTKGRLMTSRLIGVVWACVVVGSCLYQTIINKGTCDCYLCSVQCVSIVSSCILTQEMGSKFVYLSGSDKVSRYAVSNSRLKISFPCADGANLSEVCVRRNSYFRTLHFIIPKYYKIIEMKHELTWQLYFC